ncbi:MAG: 6-carboxytetrahydropterin synthase QueD [Gammaproteobacteria bacterium]|jgi:6-pyruvoyltetrahydropterin/6-carboxytetrahydropterin synthase
MSGRYKMKIVTDFAAAHLLRGYAGPCSRLHGHNWKVEVEVTATHLDDIGMGLDFSDIKAATKEIIDQMDHRHLNELPPFDTINPTAENISAHIYGRLVEKLNNERVSVHTVTLWETERACVSYTEEA